MANKNQSHSEIGISVIPICIIFSKDLFFVKEINQDWFIPFSMTGMILVEIRFRFGRHLFLIRGTYAIVPKYLKLY